VTRISVENISKKFPLPTGDTLLAIQDVTFSVHTGGFVCIVGPSGCGKTTLLRILSGLDNATSGTFCLNSKDSGVTSHVAMVFQDYSRSLFPWYTVRRQLEVACLDNSVSPREHRKRINDALELTQLTDYSNLHPKQLSGGMQQRVALARALVLQPSILLLDEPFGSVDAHSRYQLEDELLRIWAQHGLTVILVTHDIDEAIYLADQVLVMSARPGCIKSTCDVPLGRPRCHDKTRSDPTFGAIRRRVWELIHDDPT
jgi:NitT/TauT family transport system ATP-binding protein